MASAFGHAFSAVALGSVFSSSVRDRKFWILGIVCSIFPDADVIGFSWNVPYESFWGHRGFSHSLLFALLFGILVTAVFYRKDLIRRRGLWLILYFFLCTASHAILDAFTSGGLGIAFFSPWDNTRYFFPWRPIQVSPIGVGNFFSEWGVRVMMSEMLWIGIPGAILIVVNLIGRKLFRSQN